MELLKPSSIPSETFQKTIPAPRDVEDLEFESGAFMVEDTDQLREMSLKANVSGAQSEDDIIIETIEMTPDQFENYLKADASVAQLVEDNVTMETIEMTPDQLREIYLDAQVSNSRLKTTSKSVTVSL